MSGCYCYCYCYCEGSYISSNFQNTSSEVSLMNDKSRGNCSRGNTITLHTNGARLSHSALYQVIEKDEICSTNWTEVSELNGNP